MPRDVRVTHGQADRVGDAAAPPAAAVVDRNIAHLLHRHQQEMLHTEAVLRCAPLLRDILEVVEISCSSEGSSKSTNENAPGDVACSLLMYVLATCNGSTPFGAADLQSLTSPINTSSLRPLALMLAPALVGCLLAAQNKEMLEGLEPPRDSTAKDIPSVKRSPQSAEQLCGSLLLRIYQSMRNAMQRNYSILYPENLPIVTTLDSVLASESCASSPLCSNGGGGGGGGSATNRRRAQSSFLSPAALRGQMMSAAVYQVPSYSSISYENVPVLAYTALCGFAHVLSNVCQSRDMAFLASARALAHSALVLLNDVRYWDLARRDCALCSVNASVLQLSASVLGHVTGGSSRSGDEDGDTDDLYQSALELWSAECFLHAEHTQAALAVLPLLASAS